MDDMDWSLFDRYIAGVATPDEREEFERWLAEDPERSVMVDTLRKAVAGVDRGVSGQDWMTFGKGLPIARALVNRVPHSRPRREQNRDDLPSLTPPEQDGGWRLGLPPQWLWCFVRPWYCIPTGARAVVA